MHTTLLLKAFYHSTSHPTPTYAHITAMAEIHIQHGEVVFLHELPALLAKASSTTSTQPKSVRVMGRCVGVRPRERRVGLADRATGVWGQGQQSDGEGEGEGEGGKVSMQGAQLMLDTTLVPGLAFALDSLYQVIGELQPPSAEEPGPPVLRARVARCVDGMDVTLYEQAVRIRRSFLQKSGLALALGEQEEEQGQKGDGDGGNGDAAMMAVDGVN